MSITRSLSHSSSFLSLQSIQHNRSKRLERLQLARLLDRHQRFRRHLRGVHEHVRDSQMTEQRQRRLVREALKRLRVSMETRRLKSTVAVDDRPPVGRRIQHVRRVELRARRAKKRNL